MTAPEGESAIWETLKPSRAKAAGRKVRKYW